MSIWWSNMLPAFFISSFVIGSYFHFTNPNIDFQREYLLILKRTCVKSVHPLTYMRHTNSAVTCDWWPEVSHLTYECAFRFGDQSIVWSPYAAAKSTAKSSGSKREEHAVKNKVKRKWWKEVVREEWRKIEMPFWIIVIAEIYESILKYSRRRFPLMFIVEVASYKEVKVMSCFWNSAQCSIK